tara:strand:+ start:55 stop:609 length:555 start_codon:yes stop_codon:yes gene_type:complete
MPKIIPTTIKLKAMKLFLGGDKTAKEIATEVSTPEVEVKPVTIYAWAKKDQWGQQKDVARSNAQQKIAESEGQRFARLQEEQLVRYTEVATKANRELSGLTFNTAEGAVKALDTGIKGQRDVMRGTVDLGFVQVVLGILVEEVHGISCSNCNHKVDDQEVLNRVAIKLKTAVQNQEEINSSANQ